MLGLIALTVFIVWLFGTVITEFAFGLVHILLIVAAIILIIHMFREFGGRKPRL